MIAISRIIDWAFSSSVPMAELITTQYASSRDETEPSLVAAFRAGFTDHFEREEGKMLHPAI
jgi:hypothetical protein